MSDKKIPIVQQKWRSTELIGNKKTVKFKPFTLGEQKQVMLARTSKKSSDVYIAVIDLVQNCVKDIDVRELFPVEFEKLFYDIKAASKGNELEFKIPCQTEECKKEKYQQDLTINTTEDLKIENENYYLNFEVPEQSEKMIIRLRQPTINTAVKMDKKKYKNDEEKGLDIMNFCLEKIMVGEEIYDDFDYEDSKKFLDSIPHDSFKDIVEFFKNPPRLVCNKKFICEKCEKEIIIDKNNIKSFLS